eukprot:s3386_g4.t1
MCGTCSRARGHSLSASLRRQGAPEPKPLRDESNLFGKPDMSAAGRIKVEKANTVNRHAVTLLLTCYMLGSIVSIENPAGSWLWALLALLVKQTGNDNFIQWYFSLESTMFDACMHGSSRNKSTTILGTRGVFNTLAARCNHDGDLADWGAIALDPVAGARLCFAGKVPSFLLTAWRHLIGEQLICQIEMFAVLCIIKVAVETPNLQPKGAALY